MFKCQDGVERTCLINDEKYYKFQERIRNANDDYDIGAIIYDLYKLGMDSGQEFLWKIRSGDFESSNGDKVRDTYTISTNVNSNSSETQWITTTH